MSVRLLCGDALAVLPTLDACSIDAVVTDPPYGLSFMGKDWDHGVPGEAFWREVLRVAKPGTHLLAFGGTRTFHRLACAIEDAGWEIRDCLGWLYGSGFPKSLNLDGERKGWGTALKPAWEPIILARKPLEGTVAANVQKWGTGALNIDGCRIEGAAGSGVWGSSNRTCQDGRSFNGSPDGEDYRSAAHPAGRWPANLAHDGSEEVVAMFPKADAGVAVRRRSGGNTFGTTNAKPPLEDMGYGDSGNAARFFYCAKASKEDRDGGLEYIEPRASGYRPNDPSENNLRTRRHGQVPRRNSHPTVKPTDLMRWLCRLVTPPGGVVLDPFMGSGSTGRAAVLEGADFIGIDLEPDYLEIARRRIREAAPLFADVQP